ncbi:HAD family hydrolase [Patescibacteria group bacterium]|nr:HAD family hydrolase [Patescibacteria group bacterium]MCL5114625.1 HAD family hydrolase [Patescibacteria group bacterium]
MKIKLILFDIDNTLIYGESASRYYRQYSPLLEKTLASCLGISVPEAKRIADEHRRMFHGRGEKSFETYGVGLSEWYESICSLDPRPFIGEMPRVRSLLRSLREAGYELGAITDGPISQADRILSCAGIDKNTFSLFTGWIKGRAMPKGGEEQIFRKIITKKKLKPEEILMIGDSVNTDILPAQKCGMNILHVKGNGASEFPSISSIEELLQYLKTYE